MTQTSSSNRNPLPGIVTDQPEIFESEPILDEDTGVSDSKLNSESTDDAITVINEPFSKIKSYFEEHEFAMAKFYVQRCGEYRICGDKEKETDIEKYHRLVIEVNDLLSKFQTDRAIQAENHEMSNLSKALTNNLEILSNQLKAVAFAAEDGSLNPTQSGYLGIESKLNELYAKVSIKDDQSAEQKSMLAKDEQHYISAKDETSRLIRMGALERRIKMLENLLGSSEDKMQTLFDATGSENLVDAAEKLCSWMSLCTPDTLQRVNNEVEYLTQRLEKINEQDSGDDKKHSDVQAKAIDELYNLFTSTANYRASVPAVIRRLHTMEELQEKAKQVTATVTHLEQVQSQIVDKLDSNREDVKLLIKELKENTNKLKEHSENIEERITKIEQPSSHQ